MEKIMEDRVENFSHFYRGQIPVRSATDFEMKWRKLLSKMTSAAQAVNITRFKQTWDGIQP